MNRFFKPTAMTVACLCLFACGQRGPLQLPEQPVPNKPAQLTPSIDNMLENK